MLARKAGYIGYEGSRSVAVPAGRERQKFNQLVFKTLFAVFLIAFFLIVYVALSAARTDYGYSLMQEKRQGSNRRSAFTRRRRKSWAW